MLIGGIALGLVLGLLVGGRPDQPRLCPAAPDVAPGRGGPAPLRDGDPAQRRRASVETLRVPLLAAAFVAAALALWPNRGYPGMSLAFVGILSNAVVIVVNGGFMPIWEPSLILAGLTPADVTSALHIVLPPALDANFLLHLGPFGDVIPIPSAVHPERGLDRRPLPDRRPRVLPVRRRRAHPELDAIEGSRRSASAWPVWGEPSSAYRRRAARPACPGLTPAPGRPPPGAAAGDGQRRRGAGVAVASRSSRTWPSARAASRADHPDPRFPARDGRTRPPAPVRPPRAQRLVLRALGGPAHLAVRRPAQPAGARRGRRDLDRIGAGDRARLLRGHAPEPAAQPDRGHVRGPLGPQGGDGRQRHPPRGDRPGPADRRGHEHRPGLPADLPRDEHLGLLPAGTRRDPAADRPRGGPAQRELGAVGRRDDRRRHRLPAGRACSWRSSGARRAARLLGRQRDLSRLGGPAGDDRRPAARRAAAEATWPAGARASSPR